MNSADNGISAADEILLWLESHGDTGGWVVLDDLELHNTRVREHQVKIDSTMGLTWEDVAEAERILTEPDKLL